MRVKRYSDDEIRSILNETEGGQRDDKVCEAYGISHSMLERWRAKFSDPYDDLHPADWRRIAELRAENARLRRLVTKQAIDIAALRDALARRQRNIGG